MTIHHFKPTVGGWRCQELQQNSVPSLFSVQRSLCSIGWCWFYSPLFSFLSSAIKHAGLALLFCVRDHSDRLFSMSPNILKIQFANLSPVLVRRCIQTGIWIMSLWCAQLLYYLPRCWWHLETQQGSCLPLLALHFSFLYKSQETLPLGFTSHIPWVSVYVWEV